MKLASKSWILAGAFLCGSVLAQPPGPTITLTSADGSVLTINPFQPGPGPQKVSGSYLDNTPIGGCPKGQTYPISEMTVTGEPGAGSVSFQDVAWCNGGKLSFQGTFSGPGITLTGNWGFTTTGTNTYLGPQPPGPPPRP